MRRSSAEVCASGATAVRAATGFAFTEGPVWIAETASLIFSDIRGNAMHRLCEDGSVVEYRRPSNFANGSTRDNEGRIVTCEHGTSRLVREEFDGRLTPLVSHWQDRALNSPNDVIVDRRGRIWFTDPTYGRMADYGIERAQELDFQGVFRCDRDGALHLVADDFEQPNGLCLTDDEKVLLVSDTCRNHIRRFTLSDDGRVRGGEVFAEMMGDAPGCPDGLKMDSLGRVFSCGPGGVHVFDLDGALMDVLEVPEEATNFAWGGTNLRTLFVTAETSIYRLSMVHPGRSFPTHGRSPS